MQKLCPHGFVVVPIFTLLVFSVIIMLWLTWTAWFVMSQVIGLEGFLRHFNVDNPSRSPVLLAEVQS